MLLIRWNFLFSLVHCVQNDGFLRFFFYLKNSLIWLNLMWDVWIVETHFTTNQTHNVRSIWTTRQNQLIQIQMLKSRHSEPLLRMDWVDVCLRFVYLSAVRYVHYIRRVRNRARALSNRVCVFSSSSVYSLIDILNRNAPALFSLRAFALFLSVCWLCVCYELCVFCCSRMRPQLIICIAVSSCVSQTHIILANIAKKKWSEKQERIILEYVCVCAVISGIAVWRQLFLPERM